MVVKVNKPKLIMEEVEQFDDISIEDLVDGVAIQASSYSPMLIQMSCRTTGKRPEVHRSVIRVQPHRWEKVLPARARQLGSKNQRDRAVDPSCECFLGFPEHGEIVPCPSDSRANPRLRYPVPSADSAFPFGKADVSKVIEVREPGELTKEAIDAKLSIF